MGVAEASVRVGSRPSPCRLSTQELVELLKMPTCFGKARRIVLDHLGNRCGPRFVNDWAFVRYATEQKLGLDLTTPPRRPERSEKRVRERRKTQPVGGFQEASTRTADAPRLFAPLDWVG